MIKLQTVDTGQRERWRGGEPGEGGELDKDKEESVEAREVEKESGVMAEDEEERAEAGEVEKEHFQCSDCDKKVSFILKLKNHQAWSCKKKNENQDQLCWEAPEFKCILCEH